MRRALYVAAVLAGGAFIVAGSAWATREDHVCPPAHVHPLPSLEEMQARCEAVGGWFTVQVDGIDWRATCAPLPDVGVVKVSR